MNKTQREIFCTLGPSSLNKDFLKFSNNKVNLLRLNLSHISVSKLGPTIKFIRKYSNVPICIDTEGAQIRTKVGKKMRFKKNDVVKIHKNSSSFKLYPDETYDQLKKNDILEIGFNGLKIKILRKKSDKIYSKVISSGLLENSKGVHLINRKIKLNFITKKDSLAIKIAKKLNIKHFALSFTDSYKDIIKFNKLLKNEKKIFKIETNNAVKTIEKILSNGQFFLIDRGDLSKSTTIEKLPIIQRYILKKAKMKRKKVYVATNFLESMLFSNSPTRGEVNDIYNTLEQGAAGLVLAAETAIGNYPKECIIFIKKMINIFSKEETNK